MRKKALATRLIVIGVVLTLVSAVGLFMIHIDRSSHEYFISASYSMEPAFSKGDCVKIKLGVTIDEIYVAPKPDGDIIAFSKPGDPSSIIIHRAVGNGTDTSYYLMTAGDANPAPDAWRIRETDIIGKVVEINPHIWAYDYIFWAVILAIGIAIILGGVMRAYTMRKRK